MKASTSLPGSQVMACHARSAGSYAFSYPSSPMTGDRSAEIVAHMIASKITGQEWKLPPWLPLHYLTTLDDTQQPCKVDQSWATAKCHTRNH